MSTFHYAENDRKSQHLADLLDEAVGKALIELLGMRVDKTTGRVDTSWGNKTPMGLTRTVRRCMIDTEEQEREGIIEGMDSPTGSIEA